MKAIKYTLFTMCTIGWFMAVLKTDNVTIWIWCALYAVILWFIRKIERQKDPVKKELLQACEQCYLLLERQGKENSPIGMQVKMTIEKATRQ